MWTIYHNQNCSKSRAAFDLLTEKNTDFSVVNYLETPPSIDDLRKICTKLNNDIESMIRKKDAALLGFEHDWNGWDLEQKLNFLAKNPKLLERPIVVTETTAKIGRPDHTVLLELFKD